MSMLLAWLWLGLGLLCRGVRWHWCLHACPWLPACVLMLRALCDVHASPQQIAYQWCVLQMSVFVAPAVAEAQAAIHAVCRQLQRLLPDGQLLQQHRVPAAHTHAPCVSA
jgi:hypothetical protein